MLYYEEAKAAKEAVAAIDFTGLTADELLAIAEELPYPQRLVLAKGRFSLRNGLVRRFFMPATHTLLYCGEGADVDIGRGTVLTLVSGSLDAVPPGRKEAGS